MKTVVAMIDWVYIANFFMFTLSITTPKNGPAIIVGANNKNDRKPTQVARFVNSHASQPIMTRFIQMPFIAKKLPAVYFLNSLLLSDGKLSDKYILCTNLGFSMFIELFDKT